MAKLTKAKLSRVGQAAIAHLTDAEVEADPVRAMTIAQAAMRATVQAVAWKGCGDCLRTKAGEIFCTMNCSGAPLDRIVA